MIKLRGDDHTTPIWTDELSLLFEIAKWSIYLVNARNYPELASAYGGIEELERRHAEAVRQLEQWHDDGDA